MPSNEDVELIAISGADGDAAVTGVSSDSGISSDISVQNEKKRIPLLRS
jgi:hypothetical protein